MICTLIRVDTGAAFVDAATLVHNADGSVSFQLADGRYAGQQPNAYGARADDSEPKQYQRATMTGSTVTFLTRAGDLPCVYLFGQSQVYPA